ncbi:vWA domain-containing protein [Allorhodopirellula solitaria]|uniref:VWFA domain-containing protein n=1 Tax=Allorhodopirellula solitaria TaxID=2527987 RepID=A0A5C5XW06_9BACT|nr:hypothetical protein [Allorhodopirellula solitaria]TWT67090.1 hypothetical protein CA85_19360 [Allorhodopirellula solitaria]
MTASLVIHTGVIIGLLWLASTQLNKGTPASPTVRSVGMAIAHRMPDHTRYVTEPAPQSSPAAATVSTSEAASASQRESDSSASDQTIGVEPPIDLSAVLAEISGAGNSRGRQGESEAGTGAVSSDSLVQGRIQLSDGRSPNQLGQNELVPGMARTGQGAGQTTTQVFGVSGSGSTFVYVFDRSESMRAAGSAPLRAAKTELIRSLESLTERQQFQIIFYNDAPDSFGSDGDAAGLVTGEPATIERACDYVRRTVAVGGTEHEPALRMALRLAPDVIFFLTDAKIQTMSPTQLDDIARKAQNAGTTIHAIQFGTGAAPPDTFLKKLIRRGGGGYRYVDVTDLK